MESQNGVWAREQGPRDPRGILVRILAPNSAAPHRMGHQGVVGRTRSLPQTFFSSAGSAAAGEQSAGRLLGQRTNFGDVGRNTPARPEGSGTQCPSHGDWDLHILHPTTRVPPLHPGAPRGAVRQRDLPARPGCAGSSRPCSAQRGPRGARGAAAQPPAPRPRSRQRRQTARASRTSSASRTARTALADPARPQPAPWPARATACALHSCRGSTAAGSAGEGMRGRGHAKGGEAPRLDPLPSKSWGG